MSRFEEILSRDRRLIYKTMGVSMLPMLHENRDLVVIEPLKGRLRKYDVALYKRGTSYVLHRVMEVTPDRVVLMGDGNIRGQEVCRPEDVLARVDEIVAPDSTHRRLDTPKARRRARLWRRLLPVRRWLLAIYKRTMIRNIPIH